LCRLAQAFGFAQGGCGRTACAANGEVTLYSKVIIVILRAITRKALPVAEFGVIKRWA
jgi:hypothetical protein